MLKKKKRANLLQISSFHCIVYFQVGCAGNAVIHMATNRRNNSNRI